MNPLGIFARTFPRPRFEECLDAVQSSGLQIVQFSFAAAGLPTLPESLDEPLVQRIKTAALDRGISIAAVSGTFNLIDPDTDRRDENLRRLGHVAGACEAWQAPVITLSTGTRNPDQMWEGHPENNSASAWKEMLESIGLVLWITEPYNITLAFEPEPGNVASNAQRARKLLDEIKSPRLRVLFDAANILRGNPDRPHSDVLNEAFELLGRDIALVHGKELGGDDPESHIPGHGSLDWDLYLRLIGDSGYRGPIILHGFEEPAAVQAIEFVRSRMSR